MTEKEINLCQILRFVITKFSMKILIKLLKFKGNKAIKYLF